MFMSSKQLDEHIQDQHLDDMEEYNSFDNATENAIQDAVEYEDTTLQQSIEEFLVEDVMPISEVVKTEEEHISETGMYGSWGGF